MPDFLNPQADDQTLLTQVVDHYHQTLKQTTEALDYLAQQGITSPEAIDHFRIGFADHSLANLLPNRQVKSGIAIRARLRQLGLMRSLSRHHFKGCIVFPIADGSRIVDIYGRRLARRGSPDNRHLSDRGVWNIEGLGNDEIILCQSVFDALSFWQAGLRNVTCTFGTLTEDHLTAFRLVRRVLLTDQTVAPRLQEAGIECRLLQFPAGMDANQYARKSFEPAKLLGEIIAKAVSLEMAGCPMMSVAREATGEPKQAEPIDTETPRTATFCVDDDQTLLAHVVDHYHRTLKNTKEALNYLARRGITSPEAIDYFRIGFVDHSLANALPSRQSNAGVAIRARLLKLGVMRSQNVYHFKGCLVFPITENGQIVDIYGHRLSKGHENASLRHRRLSGRGVWNAEALTDTIILCPSFFDALTFWNAGYRSVTCAFDSLTEEHFAAFRRHNTRRVLLTDPSLAPRLIEAGIECFHLPLPKGLDAHKVAVRSRKLTEALAEIIDKAQKLGADGCPVESTERVTLTVAKPVERPTESRSAIWQALCENENQKLMAQVIDYYHHTIKESTEALDYLRAHGITNSEIIERFRVGFANRTLSKKLPMLGSGKRVRGQLQTIGIFRGSGHEHFNGCIVFPLMAADGSGRVVDIFGRRIRKDQGAPVDVFLSEQYGVWNVEAFQAGNEIIVCSSLIDALTFWNAGYRNVTCTFGAVTEDHLTAFHTFGIERALLTTEAIAPKLLEAGIECFLLKFPAYLTVNEFALQVSDPAEDLGAIIRKAEWLGHGKSPAKPAVSADADDEDEDGTMARPDDSDVDDDGEADVLDENALDDDDWDEREDEEDDQDDDDDQTAKSPTILTASPLPPPPKDVDADVTGDEVRMQLGHRRYRIRGLSKNLSFSQLKVNILATTDKGMFVDSVDLYLSRHRRQFICQAAAELGVEENTIKKDLGRVLLKLEELQDEQIAKAVEPKQPALTMTPEERDAAMSFLRDPKLLDRIVGDFDVVGETTNKLVGYLAAVSRKLDQPLAIILQSSSAAGKTSLMDAILAFVPPEDRQQYSAMTGQALYYLGEDDLKHKILGIVEGEGAQRASYALKLLQSEGALTIASTGKDGNTGRMVTQEYRVEGPTALFLTTTAIKIDEELSNRSIVLSVDEDREQTRAIHQFQRRRQTLAGLLADQDRQKTLALHRNAQRLLRPLLVANPYAEALTFQDDKTRCRRDHVKYLTLIRAVALLHQYQREIKTTVHNGQQVEYVEVTLDDIAVANRLAYEVLGRSVDELPPQTQRLLDLIDEMVTTACEQLRIDRMDYRFSRRDVREFTHWGHTQLKVHLKRLEDMEYLLVHRGGRGQSFVYELLYDCPTDAQSKFLARLIDVDDLKRDGHGYGSELVGVAEAGGRAEVGAKSASNRADVGV